MYKKFTDKDLTKPLQFKKGLKQFRAQEAILARGVGHVRDLGVAALILIPPGAVLVLTAGAGRVPDLTRVAVLVLLIILEIFGAFGRIKHIELALDEKWQTNRGIAYIEFDTRLEAEKAISYMDGVMDHHNPSLSLAVRPRYHHPDVEAEDIILPLRHHLVVSGRVATVLVADLRCGDIHDPDLPPVVEDHIHTATHTVQGVDLDLHTREAVAEVTLVPEAVPGAEVAVATNVADHLCALSFFFSCIIYSR
ncbi:7190_t:CDS:2 [Acaulospora morrowiae]|uniref:7190_t:CDS:1 n=1 Tax=Acaulospora morrowiae TaxID=94023 RepID=A0A9N8Z1C5_9GLOM|nr:7190_t:CDS:2 [Acaulospora morrowiae]